MLGIRCVQCNRMAGSTTPCCDMCKESFTSPELVRMILTAREDPSILGIYSRDPITKEWAKEEVSG